MTPSRTGWSAAGQPLDLLDEWITGQSRMDRMLRPYADRLLGAAGITSGAHVVDVGCGTGATTAAAALRASPGGTVLGIDISAPMLAAARRHTAGLGGVRLVRGDAQTHPFAAGGYDVVISRFGMGHFADPSSALRNIGAALRPRGRLVFTEWGEGAANEWMTLADEVGATAVGRRWRAAPAMRSASERLIRAVGSAGLAVISVEAVVEPLCVGQDVADVLAWFETLPDSRPLRVLSNTDRHAYLVALGAELEARRTSAGILLGASAWLVTAHRPANR